MLAFRFATILCLGLSVCGTSGETSQPTGKSIGLPVAAIAIDVYSDYQCPACKALHEQTLKPLIADYVRPGKVLLRRHDFPLPMHQYAKQAACYACAASRIGKYEQAADALFARQESWAKDGKVDEVVSSVLSPEEAKKVRALAKSPDVAAEVERDVMKGKEANVRQTPTMVLSHNAKTYPISGNVSYPILRRLLDQLLNQ
jgi:protein-disulfide isomerase